jgi:type 1 glutamine amidotransferase
VKKLGVAVAVLLALLAGVALWLWPSIRAARGGDPPVYDTVAPELPAELLGARAPGEIAILVFSKTNGFRHEQAIPACEQSARGIAARRGWRVFATENGAVFDDALLAHFDVVVGNNTTGDNWNAEQKGAFVRFMRGGGGFVGVHGAAGTRYEYWDWYKDALIGARFVGHPVFPQLQDAAVAIEDAAHPAMRALPARWLARDEWYSFAASPRLRGAHVLATLDESTYAPRELLRSIAMGDHPIAWTRCVGRGRSFYSALGHGAATYATPEHAAMLEGAIAWAADRSVCAENTR